MTDRSPTFSVVVPAFNSEGRVAATIASVLTQSRNDLELIVVDDGSEDGTLAAARREAGDDRRVRIVSQANRGTVAARNHGARIAAGRFLSFLDDDDLWLPEYLARAGAALDSDPGAGLAYSDAWVLDDASGRVGRLSVLERYAAPLRRLPASVPPERALSALLRANFLTTCSVTISRRALSAAGELDPALLGTDDWDLWLRIAAAGFGLVRVEGRLAVLRKRTGSVSSDELLMARNARAALAAALRRGLPLGPRRIAGRHLRAIDREIAALQAGSRARRLLWGSRRRLGRKRVRLHREGGWIQPPAEVARVIRRGETDPGDARPALSEVGR